MQKKIIQTAVQKPIALSFECCNVLINTGLAHHLYLSPTAGPTIKQPILCHRDLCIFSLYFTPSVVGPISVSSV